MSSSDPLSTRNTEYYHHKKKEEHGEEKEHEQEAEQERKGAKTRKHPDFEYKIQSLDKVCNPDVPCFQSGFLCAAR